MLPMPQISPFASPAEKQAHRRDVLGRAESMAGLIGHYKPVKICTPGGVLLEVLAMPEGRSTSDRWPGNAHVSMSPTQGVGPDRERRELGSHTDKLSFAATFYRLMSCGRDDESKRELLVHGRFLGFAHAVPFRVHYAGDDWVCIGGKVTAPVEGADEFTVADAKFKQADSGVIGLRIGVNAGTGAPQTVEWVMTAGSPSVESTPSPVFVPVAAVAVTDRGPRVTHFLLQMPLDISTGGTGVPTVARLGTTSASGTLLDS